MRKLKLVLMCCMFITALFSCSDDVINDSPENVSPTVQLNYDESMEHFGVMLSKAVSEKKEMREFIKKQVLKKIDNCYNIFYPVVKDEMVCDGVSFRQMLLRYASNENELREIEKNLPLLNIHMPQFDSIKVTSLNVADDELPVLVNEKLYVKGEQVDTIGEMEIPVFNVLVVTESSTIRKKSSTTRSNSLLSLNGEYEYTNIAFVPRKNDTRSVLLYDEDIVNDDFESEERRKYDIEKYHGSTLSVGYFEPRLINAFKIAGKNRELTRCLMYYNLKSASEEFSKNKQIDCSDCIFRFRLTTESFSYINDHNGGDQYFTTDDTHNKSHHLTRPEILNRLKTGRVIDFLFHVVDTSTQNIPFSVQPEDVFNVSISYEYVHKTLFRRSNNIYRIDLGNFKSKWYYPHEHGINLRFTRWDIFRNSINKKLYFYFVPTKNGVTQTLTEETTLTYLVNNSVNAKISADSLSKGVKAEAGYNGSWNKTHSKRTTIVNQYQYRPLLLSECDINFFEDYPISSINNGKVTFNHPIATGGIMFDILPVSNDFFNDYLFK